MTIYQLTYNDKTIETDSKKIITQEIKRLTDKGINEKEYNLKIIGENK